MAARSICGGRLVLGAAGLMPRASLALTPEITKLSGMVQSARKVVQSCTPGYRRMLPAVDA